MQDIKKEQENASGTERSRTQHTVQPVTDAQRTWIGPYQLIAKIGEGGMGTVWLTRLPGPAGFNKLAVVKELREELANSSAFVEMFLNEASLAARLTHPNVVHTYGADEDRGRLYIAMEYLDGQPWSRVRRELWSNRSLPLALHLKVLADTLSGLHHAHELHDYDGTPLQVVHRDMSPQNMFVTYDGQVKVVDFGVARAVNSRKDTTFFVGKLAYSAPEQLRGETVDRRADVFAVGVMLWEALAGRRLMSNQGERAEAARQRSSEPAPRIRDVAPNVPRVLADICDRALSLEPADRFATAAEFRDAILGFLADTSQQVDSAQLGKLIANAFRDERRVIQGLIERTLMQPPPPAAQVTDLVVEPSDQPVDHTIRADLSELALVSSLPNERAMLEATNSVSIRVVELKRPVALWVAVAFVGFAGVAWFVTTGGKESVTSIPLPATPQEERASAVADHDLSQPPGVPLQTTVQLTIRATPEDATIYMDGTPLSNPFEGRVEADGELHLIRVTAPGAQTQERVIALDRDKSLAIELVRIPARLRAQSPTIPTGRRAPSVPAPREEPSVARTTEEVTPLKVTPERNDRRPARAVTEADFDMPIATELKPRAIYEEDPY